MLVKFPDTIDEDLGYTLVRREGELGHYSRALNSLCADYRREDADGETLDAHVTVKASELSE